MRGGSLLNKKMTEVWFRYEGKMARRDLTSLDLMSLMYEARTRDTSIMFVYIKVDLVSRCFGFCKCTENGDPELSSRC